MTLVTLSSAPRAHGDTRAHVKIVRAEDRYPEPQVLSEAPAVWVIDDAMDETERRTVVALFGEETFVEAEADYYAFDERGFVAELAAERHPLLATIAARLEQMLQRRSATCATLRFRYYGPGQGHGAHVDTYTADGVTLGISALVCLAAPESGGETDFPLARPTPVRVQHRPGRLIAWNSTLPSGDAEPASRHEGLPVEVGSKCVLLAFLYLRPNEHAIPLRLQAVTRLAE